MYVLVSNQKWDFVVINIIIFLNKAFIQYLNFYLSLPFLHSHSNSSSKLNTTTAILRKSEKGLMECHNK